MKLHGEEVPYGICEDWYFQAFADGVDVAPETDDLGMVISEHITDELLARSEVVTIVVTRGPVAAHASDPIADAANHGREALRAHWRETMGDAACPLDYGSPVPGTPFDTDELEDMQTNLCDLLANLRHLADSIGLNYDHADIMGGEHYTAEIRDALRDEASGA